MMNVKSSWCLCLSFLLFLIVYLANTNTNENKNIIKKMEQLCQKKQKILIISDLTDFDWDTVYIVEYGFKPSEYIYNEFHLTGKDNITDVLDLTLYFSLNNKVVYIENKHRYMDKMYRYEDNYIQFIDKKMNGHTTKSGVSAIYTNKSALQVGMRKKINPGETEKCIVTQQDE
ncbi:hypothetical protein FNO19_02885 [Salmonella enterica subsp. salamae]|nr:hypothetical protein [Salmonella enterica subsp. salamae]